MSRSHLMRRAVCVAGAILTLSITSTAIARPNLLGAWESGNGTGLMWSNGDNNVQSFRIYRREGASSPWRYIAPVGFAGALYQYTDSPVPRGQELCYMIGAKIAGQSGIRMSNQRCYTPAALPARPSNVRLESIDARKVTVAWTDASSNETGFLVQSRRWGVDASWRNVHSASAAAGTGARYTFDDTDVDMEYRTCYRVGARSSSGTTIWASIQCGDVPGWTSNTSLDQDLALTQIESPGSGQIRIKWVENLTTTEFEVTRFDFTGNQSSTVGHVRDHTSGSSGSILSFTDTGLDTDRVYCYTVKTNYARSNTLCTSPFDRTGGGAPATPDLEVTASANRRIAYNTTVRADAIGTFVMLYASDDGVANRLPQSLYVGAGSYSDEASRLDADTRYCLIAIAYNRSGIAASAPACTTTLNSVPLTPENLRVMINTNARIRFVWDPAEDQNADDFDIRWTGRNPGANDDDGGANGIINTVYDLHGIGGHEYCAQVRGRNDVGVSQWSGEVCAVATPERDDGAPDSHWECGLTCPDGYHSENETNTLSCPDAQPAGATLCVENSPTFWQCGLTCPDGYHATQLGFSNECAVWADPAALNNVAVCTENVGNFVACGTSCPSGWRAVETGTASYCKTTDIAPRDWVACVPE